jgi:hypothetical protein
VKSGKLGAVIAPTYVQKSLRAGLWGRRRWGWGQGGGRPCGRGLRGGTGRGRGIGLRLSRRHRRRTGPGRRADFVGLRIAEGLEKTDKRLLEGFAGNA